MIYGELDYDERTVRGAGHDLPPPASPSPIEGTESDMSNPEIFRPVPNVAPNLIMPYEPIDSGFRLTQLLRLFPARLAHVLDPIRGRRPRQVTGLDFAADVVAAGTPRRGFGPVVMGAYEVPRPWYETMYFGGTDDGTAQP